MQEQFSSKSMPTVWRIVPVYERFTKTWQTMSRQRSMAPLEKAINSGITNLEKYYNKIDKSLATTMSLCKSVVVLSVIGYWHTIRLESLHQELLLYSILDWRRPSRSWYYHEKDSEYWVCSMNCMHSQILFSLSSIVTARQEQHHNSPLQTSIWHSKVSCSPVVTERMYSLPQLLHDEQKRKSLPRHQQLNWIHIFSICWYVPVRIRVFQLHLTWLCGEKWVPYNAQGY